MRTARRQSFINKNQVLYEKDQCDFTSRVRPPCRKSIFPIKLWYARSTHTHSYIIFGGKRLNWSMVFYISVWLSYHTRCWKRAGMCVLVITCEWRSSIYYTSMCLIGELKWSYTDNDYWEYPIWPLTPISQLSAVTAFTTHTHTYTYVSILTLYVYLWGSYMGYLHMCVCGGSVYFTVQTEQRHLNPLTSIWV